jgi:DNA ligase-1
MRPFAELLDRLVLTPQRNAKIKLMADYFRDAPDPDRGYALAAIAGTLTLKAVKPNVLRQLVLERMDEVLFRYSYDYVGDLAETISLVWEPPVESQTTTGDLSLGAVMHQLETAGRANVHGLVRDLLDQLEGSSRFAFLKLITGGLRIGVSARLVKQALADIG